MVYKNSRSRFQMLSWCCSCFLALICAALFAIDLYFNIALSDHDNVKHHRYQQLTPSNFISQYWMPITPASWTFIVWIVLYALITLWFLFVFYLMMCRQLCSRDMKSSLFPSIFWFLFSIVHILNGVWLYLGLRQNIVISGIVLLVLTIMLYVLWMMVSRVCWQDVTAYNDSNDVESSDDEVIELSCCEVMLLRLLTLNIFPFYAIWCTLMACLQWAIIFHYSLFHWSQNLSCIISLAVLSVFLLMYWMLSSFVKREWFTWTWLPTISVIVGCIAVIVRQHTIGGRHAPAVLFVFILMLVSIAVLVFRFVTLCLCPPKFSNHRFSRV